MKKKDFKRSTNPVLSIIGELENENKGQEILIEDIRTGEPFVSLFPIREELLAAITESMKTGGFDPSQPLIIWEEQEILLDGHTRLQAAKAAGLDRVPTIKVSLQNEEAALDYMYRLQFSRRNIKDSELIVIAQNVMKQYVKNYGKGGKPEFLAGKLPGLSAGKAARLISVLERATSEQLAAITDENATINSIYKDLKKTHVSPFEEDKKTPKNTTKEPVRETPKEAQPDEPELQKRKLVLEGQIFILVENGTRKPILAMYEDNLTLKNALTFMLQEMYVSGK